MVGEAQQDDRHFIVRLLIWLANRLRPELGWIAFLLGLSLAILPGVAIHQARWVNLSRMGITLVWIGPVAVATTWLLVHWTRPLARRAIWARMAGAVIRGVGVVVAGLMAVSQALIHWFPGFMRLWQAAVERTWPQLARETADMFLGLGQRLVWWWQGVEAGGAAQDNLVFVLLAAVVLWTVGVLTAWLVLRYRSGLLMGLPTLFLLSLILYYSSQERLLLVLAVGLTVFLHMWLDENSLFVRWQANGVDFSPLLLYDRLFASIGVSLAILVLATVTPTLSIRTLSWRAYQALTPIYDRTEAFGKRLFPDLERSFAGRRGTVVGGLPNDFLLGSGPELGEVEVMRVRTNVGGDEPQGYYMRGATLTVYNGRGWSNPAGSIRRKVRANQDWGLRTRANRSLLLQSVRLTFRSDILYGAGEPLEPGIEYVAELRGEDDLVALWAPGQSYSLVSAIPAVDEETLSTLPGWDGERALPSEMAVHLALPDTITQRTRDLAEEITAGLDSPYAKAHAIETFLRGYEYDLDVPAPPSGVDVVDFFLFDLKRGYCDYYSTAFIVLARLNGLPARFATGYAVGNWDMDTREWIITEAEAHSWPEVYFPDVGWVPFEPTAGRPALVRRAAPKLPQDLAAVDQSATDVQEPRLGIPWNWQMLFWLAPLAAILWLVVIVVNDWLSRREDPWLAMLRWGRRLGRPAHPDETELEYGEQLGRHLAQASFAQTERVRYVSRLISALSQDVSRARYGPQGVRAEAVLQARQHWRTVRGHLWRLWARRVGRPRSER
jgi:transglutaminase-like putative cysteine protease